MRRFGFSAVIIYTVYAGAALAQPAVSAVENNYSYLFPGLPNYALAQGSIFVIFGSGLANADSGLQSPPLRRDLAGVSVTIAVNQTTTQALLYYVTASQIAGILPSNTPAGTGSLTVFVNGQMSSPAPITVVQSAFGILTANQSGLGPAAAFDANSNPLRPANSANPGDTITLWGTGLGPIAGDESVAQPQDLSNIPIEVDIGGINSAVAFHGRSQYPGLDQINVVVPHGALGCSVSVVVRAGNIVSNSASIPVAPANRTCFDAGTGTVESLNRPAGFTVGLFNLFRSIVFNPAFSPAVHGVDIGSAVFEPLLPAKTYAIGQGAPFPSAGSCLAFPSRIQTAPSAPSSPAAPPPIFLDAGPSIHFTGPAGAANLALPGGSSTASQFTYGSIIDNLNPPFLPDSGGTFSIDNGSGGPDVGPFSVQFTIPPAVIWTNFSSIGSIERTRSLTLTWTGGDPNGIVQIRANSFAQDQSLEVALACSALVSAGQFTIPASALLALPPYQLPPQGGIEPQLSLQTNEVLLFSAPGLDAAEFVVGSSTAALLPYR